MRVNKFGIELLIIGRSIVLCFAGEVITGDIEALNSFENFNQFDFNNQYYKNKLKKMKPLWTPKKGNLK